VEFDPTVISFTALLERCWAGHDPTFGGSGQYRAALFAHGDAQFRAAHASAEQVALHLREPVSTEIARDAAFWPAEGYHQKWRLRRHAGLLADLQTNYPDEAALLASTASAKLNAYVGGGGSEEQVARDAHRMGLSETSIAMLGSAPRRS